MLKGRFLRVSFFIVFIFFIFVFWNQTLAKRYENSNERGIVFWHGDINQKKIALTFDDGPNNLYTPLILDILKRYNIKATFFLIGRNVERFPLIAKRIVDEGHCIGNHSYSHPDFMLETNEQIENQIKKTEEAITKATGTSTFLLRPPYGIEDHRILVEAEKLGFVIVQWSASGGNGGGEINSLRIIKNILSDVKNGAIILLHDGNRLSKNPNRTQVVEALPVIIETLEKNGYVFVTVPELLNLKY